MATNQHATAEELLEAVFSVVGAANVATQWRSRHASTSIEELCFLRGPCRRVINATSLELSSDFYRSPASRRRQRKGSLESETVKYGRESHGTRTRE
jgi:hypothetical protein